VDQFVACADVEVGGSAVTYYDYNDRGQLTSPGSAVRRGLKKILSGDR
jgi:hypothetical protein